jgi:hypothetical protein
MPSRSHKIILADEGETNGGEPRVVSSLASRENANAEQAPALPAILYVSIEHSIEVCMAVFEAARPPWLVDADVNPSVGALRTQVDPVHEP